MRSGRENKGPSSTDLLVCFPPRTHLALMQKPIYSPARTEPGTRRHGRHARKPSNRGIFAGGIGHASPLLRARTNTSGRHMNNSDNISEPTSPKVTCAGQIKIKHKPTASCSNWQSVMEEIERLHNSRKQKKRHAWAGAFGFKKDVMQFLTCLRNIRFDFRCFGSFPTSVVDDDDEDEDEEYEDESEDESYRENISRRSQPKERTNDDETDDHQSSKTVFSKWFMVLQEDHRGKEYATNESNNTKTLNLDDDEEDEEDRGPCVPPPNALLLMRCRSAPLNKWLQEEKDEEKEKEKEKERLLVMTCGEDHFSKLSTDVAKETWIVGAGISTAMLSRSRSCRR